MVLDCIPVKTELRLVMTENVLSLAIEYASLLEIWSESIALIG